MLNSKQSDDFITWLNIDGVTKWTEPALKTKLKELFDNAINQAVDESLSEMVKKVEGLKKDRPHEIPFDNYHERMSGVIGNNQALDQVLSIIKDKNEL